MFIDYLKNRFQARFDELYASFFSPKNTGFFITDFSAKDEILKSFEAKEILPNFYLLSSDFKAVLSHSEFFSKGQIYIQNPSSYLAALNLELCCGDEFCDMCASPGGKSIALASLAKMKNILVNGACIEADKTRFFTLKANLAKYDLAGIRTYNKDARSIAKTCPARFDKIMLDAPCSSYSHFGADFKEKTKAELKAISKLQKGLLNAALCALKDGGEMIYSTCTFFEAENEEVIQNALNSKFSIEILPLNLPENIEKITSPFGTLILPDHTYNGFFISKIKKIK